MCLRLGVNLFDSFVWPCLISSDPRTPRSLTDNPEISNAPRADVPQAKPAATQIAMLVLLRLRMKQSVPASRTDCRLSLPFLPVGYHGLGYFESLD